MPDLTRSHIEEAIRELTDRYMFQAVTPMTQATFAIDVANALDIPHGWVRTEAHAEEWQVDTERNHLYPRGGA
jgi:hypothetical protein